MPIVLFDVLIGTRLGFNIFHVFFSKQSSLLPQEGTSVFLKSCQPVGAIDSILSMWSRVNFVKLGEVFREAS